MVGSKDMGWGVGVGVVGIDGVVTVSLVDVEATAGDDCCNSVVPGDVVGLAKYLLVLASLAREVVDGGGVEGKWGVLGTAVSDWDDCE